jgi:hypothetical protein
MKTEHKIVERLRELTETYTAGGIGKFFDEAFECYLSATNQAHAKLSAEFRILCELKETLNDVENLK